MMGNKYQEIMADVEALAAAYAGHPLANVHVMRELQALAEDPEVDAVDIQYAVLGLYLSEYSARRIVRPEKRESAKQLAESGIGLDAPVYLKFR